MSMWFLIRCNGVSVASIVWGSSVSVSSGNRVHPVGLWSFKVVNVVSDVSSVT
jgi:hypothetical protein